MEGRRHGVLERPPACGDGRGAHGWCRQGSRARVRDRRRSGPSGRLGGWAIAGIPAEVCELHSTRSAQITAVVGPDASYAARSVAARATRDRKAEVRVEDLLTRWQDELTAAGHPPADLVVAVEAAGSAYQLPEVDLEELASELLGPGGRLASEKTFTRGDVIIAAAPHLHGLPLSVLDQAVETVLANTDAVALPIVTGSREQVWTARCVLADEERIATLAEQLTSDDGPKVEEQAALGAVASLEERLGVPLTPTQQEVAIGLLVSGHDPPTRSARARARSTPPRRPGRQTGPCRTRHHRPVDQEV